MNNYIFSLPKLLLLLCLALIVATPALADQPKLFVNLTSDDPWRAGMALKFSENALKQRHPVTIFLNIRGVNIAAKNIPQYTNGITGKTTRQMLKDVMAAGAKVIVCPMCMKQAGLEKDDLIKGVTIGDPKITLPLLFAEDTRVMSY